MKIDFNAIMNKFRNKAHLIFEDNGRLKNLIVKTKNVINENEELNSLIADIKMLIELIKDYKNNNYKEISKNSIIMIIMALIYLVNPMDLIPDFLVGGFIDDAAVIAYVLKKIQVELKHYKDWKNGVKDDSNKMEDNVKTRTTDHTKDNNGYHEIKI